MRVYLAGPIRNAEDDGRGWRDDVADMSGFMVVNPLDEYDHTSGEWSPYRVVESDLQWIRHCDVMLVNWSSDVKSVGTPMEILYAHRVLDIPVYAVCDGDVSPWITAHCRVVDSVSEAVAVIESMT